MIFVCIKTRYALEYKLKPDEQKPLLKQKVGHAFDAFESWCMQYHGKKATQDKYSYVVYEIQPYAAVDLPKLMEQFRQHTNIDIGIGLGFTEDEADAAAEVAFNKGLKHPLLMTEALVEFIDNAKPEETVSKAEPVPVNSIKSALQGAAIANLISSRGRA